MPKAADTPIAWSKAGPGRRTRKERKGARFGKRPLRGTSCKERRI